LIIEVSNRPHVVNPLTVSINSKSKEKLFFDLRHVNKQVLHRKFKFEDWRTLKQYVKLDSFGLVFDLKSRYHHIDIHDSYQTNLGFSRKIDNIVNYFVFTVLPFRLRSSAYIFSKILRPLVKKWRQQSIKIVLYLDDCFGISNNYFSCAQQATQVKHDIITSGLVLSKYKSI